MPAKRVGRPPDGGWGWLVMAGCFTILMTFFMFSFGYSILFSDFLLSRGASSTTIAWIFNVHVFFVETFTVFAEPLTKEFGFRRTCLVGCGLVAVCVFALVFVDSLWGLGLFYCLAGVFGGLGASPCYLLFTIYFDRKRGLANAFLQVGAPVSQFLGPPLIRYLLSEYGRQGATLLLCGVVLQCIVGAALFQPVEWHMKVDVEEAGVEEEKQEDEKMHESHFDAAVTEEMVTGAERRKMLDVDVSRQPSDTPVLSLGVSNTDLSRIPCTSRQVSYIFDKTSNTNKNDNTRKGPLQALRGFLKLTSRVVKEVICNFMILKSPRSLIIVLGVMFNINAYLNFIMMAPFAIQSAGYSLSDAAWCMSIAAVTNFVSRFVFSVLSDQPWFNVRLAYMAGISIFSVSSAVFGFLRSLTHMQVIMAVWGVGLGTFVPLGILCMSHYMGAEKMGAIFGVNSLVYSVSTLVLGPLFGMIRDASESYGASMLAMGCCGGLSVLLWCFMPAAVAYDERKEAEQKRREEERLAEKV